jgi:hypothetical protein
MFEHHGASFVRCCTLMASLGAVPSARDLTSFAEPLTRGALAGRIVLANLRVRHFKLKETSG